MWLFLASIMLGAVRFATCSTVAEANHFIDNLLGSKLEQYVEAYGLNGVPIPSWTLEKIKSTAPTNRDVKGNLTRGFVRGLTAVKRRGDCSPTIWMYGNISLFCHLGIDSVYPEWLLTIKGYEITGRTKQLFLKAPLKGSAALLEVSALPNSAASLRTLFIKKLHFEISYADLGLNTVRRNNLHDQIEKHAAATVYNVIYNTFAKAIISAMRDAILPPV